MKYPVIGIIFLLSVMACSESKTKSSWKKEENKVDSVKVFTLATDSVKKTLIASHRTASEKKMFIDTG